MTPPNDKPDLWWVAHCTERLREHWRRADPISLEETAFELWAEARWRELPPREAAEAWLQQASLPLPGQQSLGL